jgi:hypothetical protein
LAHAHANSPQFRWNLHVSLQVSLPSYIECDEKQVFVASLATDTGVGFSAEFETRYQHFLVSIFPTPTFFGVDFSDTDTTIFGVGKSDTDTDIKVLRGRRYFLILNPTLFEFFSFKTQKKKLFRVGVGKTETEPLRHRRRRQLFLLSEKLTPTPTPSFFDVDISTPTPTPNFFDVDISTPTPTPTPILIPDYFILVSVASLLADRKLQFKSVHSSKAERREMEELGNKHVSNLMFFPVVGQTIW